MKNESIEKLVSYYQNRIERITNKKLHLETKSMTEIAKDDYYNNLINIAQKIETKDKSNKSKILEFILKKQILKITYPIFYFTNLINSFLKCGVYFHNSKENKDVFYYSPYHKNSIDKTIVHEVCHSLWFDLEGLNPTEDSFEKEKWMEGFAYYGENIYFNFIKNIYPKEKSFLPKIPVKIENGFGLVRKVIDKYGCESFFKIPLKWQDFEKEFND